MSDMTTAELFHRNVSELCDVDLLVAVHENNCCVDDFRGGDPDHPYHPESLHWKSWQAMQQWGLVDDNGVTPLGLDHIRWDEQSIFRRAIRIRDQHRSILNDA